MVIVPVVQSILCLEQATLCGIEVLCRFQNPSGLLSPYGLVRGHQWAEIDHQMLKLLVPYAEHLNETVPRLFLNVSAASLANTESFSRWNEAVHVLLAQLKIPLVLEISETIDPLLLRLRWKQLRDLPGIELAIDDFGDENSSLNRLLDYPWNFCKFDARYITKISHLVAMFVCQSNATFTIVERVESELLSDRCRAMGLNRQQGFLFSQPAPLSTWFQSMRSLSL